MTSVKYFSILLNSKTQFFVVIYIYVIYIPRSICRYMYFLSKTFNMLIVIVFNYYVTKSDKHGRTYVRLCLCKPINDSSRILTVILNIVTAAVTLWTRTMNFATVVCSCFELATFFWPTLSCSYYFAGLSIYLGFLFLVIISLNPLLTFFVFITPNYRITLVTIFFFLFFLTLFLSLPRFSAWKEKCVT